MLRGSYIAELRSAIHVTLEIVLLKPLEIFNSFKIIWDIPIGPIALPLYSTALYLFEYALISVL